MTTLPANSESKITAIRRSIQASYAALCQLIDGPLASVAPEKLYQPPAENEWSIMQNLAHTVEFLTYWANEVEKLIAHPGQNFGRTMQDAGRLQGISERAHNTLQQIKEALPTSYARMEQVLGNLKESDLDLTAYHVKFGECSLDWFIHEFITKHFSDHVEQIRACLAPQG
jgi:uncharacterized damage-inducible protein DinB